MSQISLILNLLLTYLARSLASCPQPSICRLFHQKLIPDIFEHRNRDGEPEKAGDGCNQRLHFQNLVVVLDPGGRQQIHEAFEVITLVGDRKKPNEPEERRRNTPATAI